MNTRLKALDKEIFLAEQLIAFNHQALDDALVQSTHRAKERARATLTSPAVILGVGSLLTYWFFKKRGRNPEMASSTTKKGMLGVLGAAGLSLAQAHFGGPVGMAQWVAGKLSRRRQQAEAPIEY